MEGRVKSHISNNTYITDLEKLEEEDTDEISELYMIPISGHKIMVAPGKSTMKDGIAFCYVYVIQKEKVVCKLGVYEKKTETMPLFFDISTFPEGSFCLFEEFEKNPTKLLDFEMIETLSETTTAVERKGQNVFDFLINEFVQIPNKKERLKNAYKALFKIYEPMKGGEKEKQYKKIKPIIKSISEAGKKDEPTDEFLQSFKKDTTNVTEEIPGSLFAMTLLALQHVFLIDFSFETENDDLKMMKTDWPITNASTVVEVDVNSYTIVDKEPMVEPMVEPNAMAIEGEPEPEPEPAEVETESKIEPEAVAEEELEEEAEVESVPEPEEILVPLTKTKTKPKSASEPEETILSLSKAKTKTKPATIFEAEPLSIGGPENVKVKKSTVSIKAEKASTEPSSKPKKSVPKQAEEPSKPASQTLYESPLSESTIQDIVARTKSHKSTAKLMKDYQAGIMPSTPEEEKRLRDSLVSMVAAKMSKKGSVAAASELAASVSKLKESKPSTPKAKETLKESVPVTLKQSRSIPKVKKTIE